MKTAVFDCPLGIAGDMTVGAFLDAGVPFDYLQKELKKLGIPGFKLERSEVICGAFRAAKFSVITGRGNWKPSGYHAKRHHTSLKEIEALIRKSKLRPQIKKNAIAIFRNLGKSEARVHGVPIQHIHFHEVGALDSIVDIVGAAVCFHYFKIRKAYVRSLTVGRGVTQGSHGEMPIPVPGTYDLLKGFSIRQSDNGKEMVTPTGAAILATLCKKTERIPHFKIESIGYGAGDRFFNKKRGFIRLAVGK